jgi:hypothetical protein
MELESGNLLITTLRQFRTPYKVHLVQQGDSTAEPQILFQNATASSRVKAIPPHCMTDRHPGATL